MDTMTEHWGHLIGRTLEPPPGEDDGESPVAAGDADGGSTTGEGDGSPTLDDDVTNDDGAGGPEWGFCVWWESCASYLWWCSFFAIDGSGNGKWKGLHLET